jgi:hypothetical protein
MTQRSFHDKRIGLLTLLAYAIANPHTCGLWVGAIALLLGREGVRHV